MTLQRGQYKVTATVPLRDASGDAETYVRDQMRAIPTQGEHKRVYVYRLSLVPTWQTTADGTALGRLTAVFHVVDNPLPLVPIIWGFNIVAGSVGSWFVVDKLEGFTSSTGGSIVTTLAAIASVGFAWVTIFGNPIKQ